MNAKQLFTKNVTQRSEIHRDIEFKSVNLWQCQCGKVSVTVNGAEYCCKKWICERCQREAYDYHKYCYSCEEFFRMEKAELVENYDGWIYVDGYSNHNEGYFESVEDFLEYYGEDLEENEESSIPEFAFCCQIIPFPSFDVFNLVSDHIDDLEDDEEMYNHIEGLSVMQKALDWFTKKNEHNVKYYLDHKRKIKLK